MNEPTDLVAEETSPVSLPPKTLKKTCEEGTMEYIVIAAVLIGIIALVVVFTWKKKNGNGDYSGGDADDTDFDFGDDD